jgi:protein SCO1/2
VSRPALSLAVIRSVALAVALLTVACNHGTTAELGRITPTSLLDQDGHPFGQHELAGHVWIAALMFTSCPMACPKMAERMARLQTMLPEHAKSIRLLSITVDAENDTPPVLSAYGKRFHRDPATWTYVTGETDRVFASVNAGYKQALGANANFSHGDTLVLLDGEGRIQGFYRKDDAGVARLFADADRLAGTRPG